MQHKENIDDIRLSHGREMAMLLKKERRSVFGILVQPKGELTVLKSTLVKNVSKVLMH